MKDEQTRFKTFLKGKSDGSVKGGYGAFKKANPIVKVKFDAAASARESLQGLGLNPAKASHQAAQAGAQSSVAGSNAQSHASSGGSDEYNRDAQGKFAPK